MSEATIRRIERAVPGEEVRPTVSTLSKLEAALDARDGFVFDLLDQDQPAGELRPQSVSTLGDVAASIGGVLDNFLASGANEGLDEYTRATVQDVADALSELYVTVLMEGAEVGASWGPSTDELYRMLGPAMTAPEPDKGTSAHRRWAYRRWLRGDYDGGEYRDEFRRRFAHVKATETRHSDTLEAIRFAAAESGTKSVAGIPISTLIAVAQRDGSCGQVYEALRHIFLGNQIEAPSALQQALIDDNAEFDGLTLEQRKLLDKWTGRSK